MTRVPPDHDAIADQLRQDSWLLLPNWLDGELAQDLLGTAQARARNGALTRARVGRSGQSHDDREIRGDAIQWLEPGDADNCIGILLDRLDGLRKALNERLFLGLVEIEAHFAHYPPGARYQRHLDRFRNDDARTLSAVIHLGAPWRAEYGGALRLYLANAGGERCIDLPPHPGQLVLFLSGEIEHEVLATARDRYSVAAWMRRRSLGL